MPHELPGELGFTDEIVGEECRGPSIRMPALVIHGEDDSLVPLTGKGNLRLLEIEEKELLTIPYGEHNTLILRVKKNIWCDR